MFLYPGADSSVIAVTATDYADKPFAMANRGLFFRFAAGVHLVRQVCPGLVERIEAGDLDSPATRALLMEYVRPSLAAGADTLVLACTHYPFVRPIIEELAGPGVQVIDPAPAVARQVDRLVGAADSAVPGASRFLTTGDVGRFESVASRLLGRSITAGRAGWNGDRFAAEVVAD